jgi:hypothetical protein
MSVLLKFKRIFADSTYWDQRNDTEMLRSVVADITDQCFRDGLIVGFDTEEFPDTFTVLKTFIYRDIEAREQHVALINAALLESGMVEEETDPPGVMTVEHQLIVDGVITDLD